MLKDRERPELSSRQLHERQISRDWWRGVMCGLKACSPTEAPWSSEQAGGARNSSSAWGWEKTARPLKFEV